jgi:hypothetical protein
MSVKIDPKKVPDMSQEEFDAMVKHFDDRAKYAQVKLLHRLRSEGSTKGKGKSGGTSDAPESEDASAVLAWLEADNPPTVKAVEGWVGDDKDRAKTVHSIESGFDDPRTTLLESLQKTMEKE